MCLRRLAQQQLLLLWRLHPVSVHERLHTFCCLAEKCLSVTHTFIEVHLYYLREANKGTRSKNRNGLLAHSLFLTTKAHCSQSGPQLRNEEQTEAQLHNVCF